MVTTLCGLPLFSVSSIILYHVAWKIKWFPVFAGMVSADPRLPASAPPLRWRRQRIFEAWGPLSPQGRNTWGCVPRGRTWPCRVVLTSRPPRREKWCGRLAYLNIYMYPNMIRRRRANNDGDRTPSVLSPSLALEGTRRASDGPRTARSKGPALCRKAGRGVTLRRRACPATWRQSCRLCRPRRRRNRRRVRTPYAL